MAPSDDKLLYDELDERRIILLLLLLMVVGEKLNEGGKLFANMLRLIRSLSVCRCGLLLFLVGNHPDCSSVYMIAVG